MRHLIGGVLLVLSVSACVTTKAQVRADIVKACAIQPTIAVVNSVVGALTAGPAGAAGAQALNAAEAGGCALLPHP